VAGTERKQLHEIRRAPLRHASAGRAASREHPKASEQPNLKLPLTRLSIPPRPRSSLNHETRLCTSLDGVGPAYAIDGEGMPLVRAGNWMTHLDHQRKSSGLAAQR